MKINTRQIFADFTIFFNENIANKFGHIENETQLAKQLEVPLANLDNQITAALRKAAHLSEPVKFSLNSFLWDKSSLNPDQKGFSAAFRKLMTLNYQRLLREGMLSIALIATIGFLTAKLYNKSDGASDGSQFS